jgi:hypothetical protein
MVFFFGCDADREYDFALILLQLEVFRWLSRFSMIDTKLSDHDFDNLVVINPGLTE